MTQPDKTTASRVTPLERSSLQEVPEGRRRSRLAAYAIAAVLTLVALGLTLIADRFLAHAVFLLFWPAVLATAWLGGFGPALVASFAAVALVDYFLLPPAGFTPSAPDEIAMFVGFVAVAGLTSYVVSIVDRARVSASKAATQNAWLAQLLEQQSVELTHQLEESQSMQEELEQSAEELAERSAEAESAERFSRGILESIADPFVVQDSDWRFQYINDAAAAIFSGTNHGPREKLIGKKLWDEYPDIAGTKFETEMRRAMETKTPVTFEAFYPETGQWAELFCYPLPDGGLATQWKNTTARKKAEESGGYLTKASELLASSLNYEQTLKEVAHLIVPSFADWCGISMLDDKGNPQQLAVAHAKPEKVKWAEELNKRYPPDPGAKTGVPQVIRTGKAELYADIPDAMLEAGAKDAE